MGIFIGVIIGLLSLTFLVAMHELGHAYMAIKNGVVVEEYAIGFPPNAIKFKKKTDWILPKGTTIAINWLPLGGYVKLQGESDSDSGEGDYGAVTFWGKTQILFAGVAMNWAISAVLLSILAIFGLPSIIPNQFYFDSDSRVEGGEVYIVGVTEEMPAKEAGLEAGDVVVSVDGKKIDSVDGLSKAVSERAGESVSVLVVRNGDEVSKDIRIINKDGKDVIGVSLGGSAKEVYSTWSAPLVGVVTTYQLTAETFRGLGEMVSNFFIGLAQKMIPTEESQISANQKLESAGAGVAGPVSIMGVLFPSAAESGIKSVIFLTAIISLSLACMNVLPIPALDGGRWMLTFIFRKILKRPLESETEMAINSIGFMAIMALSFVVIIVDIIRVF